MRLLALASLCAIATADIGETGSVRRLVLCVRGCPQEHSKSRVPKDHVAKAATQEIAVVLGVDRWTLPLDADSKKWAEVTGTVAKVVRHQARREVALDYDPEVPYGLVAELTRGLGAQTAIYFPGTRRTTRASDRREFSLGSVLVRSNGDIFYGSVAERVGGAGDAILSIPDLKSKIEENPRTMVLIAAQPDCRMGHIQRVIDFVRECGPGTRFVFRAIPASK